MEMDKMKSLFAKRPPVEPVVMLTPMQELLKAENQVTLAQGEIEALNKEVWEWQHHWGVIEDGDGQFHGILNESLLSEQVTEIHLREQFSQFQIRKNVLLRSFHEKLAAWAGLKQRYAHAIEQANALPMLASPA
jgi:hypothetical protein